MKLHLSLFTMSAIIMNQTVDKPLSKMPHSVVGVVFLPSNFLFATDYQIQPDMGGTLAALQTETSETSAFNVEIPLINVLRKWGH